MKVLHVWREAGSFYRIVQYGDGGSRYIEYCDPAGIWLTEGELPHDVLEDPDA